MRVDKPSCSNVPYTTTTRSVPDALEAEVQKCPPGPPPAPASVVIQYFRREEFVESIMRRLALFEEPLEVLVNNDSHTEHAQWIEEFKAHGNGWLVYSPDVHEIRGYNRLGKLGTAEMLAFLQDDDLPRNGDWLVHARKLFMEHKSLGLLGGFRGRMETGDAWNLSTNQMNGLKFGPGKLASRFSDPQAKIPFQFVYKVNAAPLLARRSTFLQIGMFNQQLSCPGKPGIGFDFEYSVRNWYTGHSVGLYYSQFQHQVFGRTGGGTWKDKEAWQVRKENERRSNLWIYKLYPGFHHQAGTAMADAANAQLTPATETEAEQWKEKYVERSDFVKKKPKIVRDEVEGFNDAERPTA